MFLFENALSLLWNQNEWNFKNYEREHRKQNNNSQYHDF